MSNPVITWAKENPLLAGGAALGVFVVVMLISGGGSNEEGAASDGGAGVAAYYNAVANQSQAGAAIQIADIQANAATNQTLIAASYGLEKEKVWSASTDLATQANATTQQQAISAAENLGLAQIYSGERISANKVNLANSALAAGVKGAQGTAIVQTAISGTNAPVTYKASNSGNSASAIIGSIGNAGGSILKGLGSIF